MVIPEIVPFNAPFKRSNRVGGVKTPPYERYDKLQFTVLLMHRGGMDTYTIE